MRNFTGETGIFLSYTRMRFYLPKNILIFLSTLEKKKKRIFIVTFAADFFNDNQKLKSAKSYLIDIILSLDFH